MIDLSDGVDYIRHCLCSEKGAAFADYQSSDGSIVINLDELWMYVDSDTHEMAESLFIVLYIETLSHELKHKWFCWGMDDSITSNEIDECVMKVCSDWVLFGKMTSII